MISGTAVFTVSIITVINDRLWQKWAQIIVGLWLSASPWVLAFAGIFSTRVNAWTAGIAIAALALSVISNEHEPFGTTPKTGSISAVTRFCQENRFFGEAFSALTGTPFLLKIRRGSQQAGPRSLHTK